MLASLFLCFVFFWFKLSCYPNRSASFVVMFASSSCASTVDLLKKLLTKKDVDEKLQESIIGKGITSVDLFAVAVDVQTEIKGLSLWQCLRRRCWAACKAQALLT